MGFFQRLFVATSLFFRILFGPRAPAVLPNGEPPRRFPIGFGLTPIKPGERVRVCANPQVHFQPDSLVIPSSIASAFKVHDLLIGQRSQLTAPGAIPANSFTERVGMRLSLDPVEVGTFVAVDVTNTSDEDQNFAAALWGREQTWDERLELMLAEREQGHYAGRAAVHAARRAKRDLEVAS